MALAKTALTQQYSVLVYLIISFIIGRCSLRANSTREFYAATSWRARGGLRRRGLPAALRSTGPRWEPDRSQKPAGLPFAGPAGAI